MSAQKRASIFALCGLSSTCRIEVAKVALTFARAFLQLRHALRVTESGALRRFPVEEVISGVSISPRGRRGSDPVLSDVDWLGLLVEALLSPNEGRILRNDMVYECRVTQLAFRSWMGDDI